LMSDMGEDGEQQKSEQDAGCERGGEEEPALSDAGLASVVGAVRDDLVFAHDDMGLDALVLADERMEFVWPTACKDNRLFRSTRGRLLNQKVFQGSSCELPDFHRS
jgi:hypothetical protein